MIVAEQGTDMDNFVHDIPTKYYFGKGSIEHLPEALKQYGKTVLLTYGGGSIKRMGLYDTVVKMLTEHDFTIIECSGVEPNPRIETVARGAALCRRHHVDVVLSVGGGSTLDCAKAIACGAYYEGTDFWQMVLDGEECRKALPLVDIITLAATGSEFNSGGVITNLATKQKIGASFTFPQVSIADPTYTFTVPAYQTAAGSADIMSHIMECYFNRVTNADLSDAMEEGILKSVIRNLPIVLENPQDYEARANLLWDSSIACSGLAAYGQRHTGWSCHALEHELSAFYDITHGVGLAILTPRWLEYILAKDSTVMPRIAQFARNVWGIEEADDEKAARMGIRALHDFFKAMGIPMTLTEVGIDDLHFEDMARDLDVMRGGLLKAYVPLTHDDVVAIYRMCL